MIIIIILVLLHFIPFKSILSDMGIEEGDDMMLDSDYAIGPICPDAPKPIYPRFTLDSNTEHDGCESYCFIRGDRIVVSPTPNNQIAGISRDRDGGSGIMYSPDRSVPVYDFYKPRSDITMKATDQFVSIGRTPFFQDGIFQTIEAEEQIPIAEADGRLLPITIGGMSGFTKVGLRRQGRTLGFSYDTYGNIEESSLFALKRLIYSTHPDDRERLIDDEIAPLLPVCTIDKGGIRVHNGVGVLLFANGDLYNPEELAEHGHALAERQTEEGVELIHQWRFTRMIPRVPSTAVHTLTTRKVKGVFTITASFPEIDFQILKDLAFTFLGQPKYNVFDMANLVALSFEMDFPGLKG